ncbi:MAG: cysteine hydrolase [Deltaproteobacteria bacterium]|nr:cysteine hydrolase [Deltaproteobacteria bacterium]MBW2084831.1 cysteine hydrolase [Deltaproteobacteria bacterium]
MSRKALLVIDMLNDFLDPSGALYCGDEARKIIPTVKDLLEKLRQSDAIIIFPMDSHKPDDKEFEMFAPHCIAGTPGAALIPELEAKDGEYLVPKTRFSAFYGTNLENILKMEGVSEVHLSGVCTSICVMETVSDLRNRDYPVIVHEKAVADLDPESHEFALKRMKNILGARIEP